MSFSDYVIVGEGRQKKDQVVILTIRADFSDTEKALQVWLISSKKFARVAARKDCSNILAVEENDWGGRNYVHLHRTATGEWNFTYGLVIAMEDGWLCQGSASWEGKVIFDSNEALNLLLEKTTARDINIPEYEP